MKQNFLTLCVLFGLAAPAFGESSGGIDWSAWQRLPVLYEGRIMPLDTMAMLEVTKICGCATPQIGMFGAQTNAEMKHVTPDAVAKALQEYPPRRFSAAELLYAWTTDPEKWDRVPFIQADDETLRSLILDVPLVGEDGKRLLYVSPHQVRSASKFWQRIDDLRRQQEDNPKAPLTATDTQVKKVYDALAAYEQLASNPTLPDVVARNRAMENMSIMIREWFGLQQDLARMPLMQQPPLKDSVEEANDAMRTLGSAMLAGENSPEPVVKLEPLVAHVRRATNALADQVADMMGTPPKDQKTGKDPMLVAKRNLVDRTASVARLATQFHWNMFDSGGSLRVVPSMEPSSLEVDRYRSDVQPWVSLDAILYGSEDLLHAYPHQQIDAARKAWQEARAAYNDRDNLQRGELFAASMQRFSAALRDTADGIEPDREKLPLKEDGSLIAKTAYPPALLIDAEYVYNEADPFFWAWRLALSSAAVLGLSLVGFRKPLFWIGIGGLSSAIACIISGFLVRMFITRWAPVTSMFETVVWVTMCVSLLTMWLTFLPMFGPSSRIAWRLTAIPFSWEPGPENNQEAADSGTPWLALSRCLALTVRLGVLLIAMYVAGVFPTSGESSGYRLVAVMPRIDIGSTLPNVNSTLVWAASLFVACTMIWFIPRLVPTAIGTVFVSMYRGATEDCSEAMERVYRMRLVAMAGALAAGLAALAGYYAPFPREIHALMPVLRSNFWLGIHVLTIVSSYAGALTCWAIGNAMLANFLFGEYRLVPASRKKASSAKTTNPFDAVENGLWVRRPPAICGSLAALNYRVMQVTVLLLCAGTILGGLWADVSWGRFWGWDPKETWALNSLLIYLIVLHGRRTGWPGDLSLAAGSIVGFTSIWWAWYGVNFLMAAGLHSYGAGEGGEWWLGLIVLANWAFAVAAIVRASTATSGTYPPPAQTPIQAMLQDSVEMTEDISQ